MIMRKLDENGDFTFGAGKNNFLTGVLAIEQSIETRLLSFLGDCFFDVAAGIDWFNLLGSKNQTALNLSVSTIILNTPGVTGILQLSIVLDTNRNLTITYNASTIYSNLASSVAVALI
jgi:hypothetical protein